MPISTKEKEIAAIIESARTEESIKEASIIVSKSQVRFPIRAAAHTILELRLMTLRMSDIEERLDKLEGEE